MLSRVFGYECLWSSDKLQDELILLVGLLKIIIFFNGGNRWSADEAVFDEVICLEGGRLKLRILAVARSTPCCFRRRHISLRRLSGNDEGKRALTWRCPRSIARRPRKSSVTSKAHTNWKLCHDLAAGRLIKPYPSQLGSKRLRRDHAPRPNRFRTGKRTNCTLIACGRC